MDKSELYDVLFDQADRIVKKVNPCNIRKNESGELVCNGVSPEWCCGGCQYLTTNGCSVKALGCKLWLCIQVQGTPKGRDTFIALSSLRHFSVAVGIDDYGLRASKEDYIKQKFRCVSMS